MMPDKTIEILGRIDTQVKLRGVRIEAEGISTVVRQSVAPSPDLSLDAVTVIAKHPVIGVEQLVSFIAWDSRVTIQHRKSGVRPSLAIPPSGLIDSIRKACERELAVYMRPSHIIPLDFLPLNHNGKSDGKALTALFIDLTMSELTSLMSQKWTGASKQTLTEVEEHIITVLERHTIPIPPSQRTPELNFFSFGLDSIGLVRFCSEIQETFNRRIDASEVMSFPTVLFLAEYLSSQEDVNIRGSSYVHSFASAWSHEVTRIYGPEVEDILPPFAVQEGVLFRSVADETMYVQHVIVKCATHILPDELKRAWAQTQQRHSILR